MNQEERRQFLIEELLRERPFRRRQAIPADANRQKVLLRSLMNVRQPGAVSRRFLEVQDAYLQEELAAKKITHLSDLRPVQDGMYLWRGDITTLKCGAIVNAANSGMTGCYQPCHSCIDNCIHTFSGVQLRLECNEIMQKQGSPEKTGSAKITHAFNLPSKYVLHTVGPIIRATVTERDKIQLASCYTSCLNLAAQKGLESVAFCCISTGVFRFPQKLAAQIAVKTVKDWLDENKNAGVKKVIFNVFASKDLEIYREILGTS